MVFLSRRCLCLTLIFKEEQLKSLSDRLLELNLLTCVKNSGVVMANFICLRGWFECTYEDVESIRLIAEDFLKKHDDYYISDEVARLYHGGGVILATR